MREIDLREQLLPRHHLVLRALHHLSVRVPIDRWCLVGGLMVLIATRDAGRSIERAEQTKDADVLVDICTNPGTVTKVAHELEQFGFSPIEPWGAGGFARCTFVSGMGQIDVLCPEDATAEQLETPSGVRSLAIPGGRRALQLSEPVRIIYSNEFADVEIRVPLLPDAIIVKAAAAVDPRTADQPRHIQDVAGMLGIINEPTVARNELSGEDRALLGSLAERLTDDGDIAWDAITSEDRLRGRAALDIMSR